MPQNLWAPWRMAYVTRADEQKGCFFCRAAAPDADDRRTLVVRRGETCFTMLNKYPYNNAHLLIAPNRHEADFAALTDAETLELMRTVSAAIEVLREVVGAQGFNVGWNLGRCAGAGAPDHIHAHVVPRWAGDTNFMPVLGDVKVIPQSLDDVWSRLREAWQERTDDVRATTD